MPEETTTVRLSKDMLWRLKAYAAEHKMKTQEALEKLLHEALSAPNKKK